MGVCDQPARKQSAKSVLSLIFLEGDNGGKSDG